MTHRLTLWINKRKKVVEEWDDGARPARLLYSKKSGSDPWNLNSHILIHYELVRETKFNSISSPLTLLPRDKGHFQQKSDKYVSQYAYGKLGTINVIKRNNILIVFFEPDPKAKRKFKPNDSIPLAKELPLRLTKEIISRFKTSKKGLFDTKIAGPQALTNLVKLDMEEEFIALLELVPLGDSRADITFIGFVQSEPEYQKYVKLIPFMQAEDYQERVDFLAEYDYPGTREYTDALKDIQDWWGGDLQDSITGFYYKTRNEGTAYFFENYTSAFDHWSSTSRNKVLAMVSDMMRKFPKDEPKTENDKAVITTLTSQAGKCQRCSKIVSLEEEVSLMVRRYGMGPGIASEIRGEVREAINSGAYSCEKCLYPSGR